MRAGDLLDEGATALRNGDWTGARDAYRRALDVEVTAAALEGSATATWWLRDDAATIEARREAFRLYLDDGDAASAARVAVSLAWDHIFRGERSVAGGWVARAERLLEGLGPVAEAGAVAIVRAHIALMVDRDPVEAHRLAIEGTGIGRRVGSRDLEMLALAYEGFALVSAGRVAEGMRRLDESTTAAMSGELEGVNETGTIACCLIYACERVRDFGRAAEWCGRLKEFCERWSFELMIAICRTHYASTLVSQGAWKDAEAELQGAISGFGSTHPGQAAEALVRLADLRVRQGRLDEAEALLDTVDAGPARMMGHKIALAVRSNLLLEGGDPRAAVDTAEAFLRSIPDRSSLERAPALEVLVRAHVALGDEVAARSALAELRTLADSVRTDPMRAAALLAQGGLAHAFGDPAAARIALEDAAGLFAQVGAPYERALASLLLARRLAADARPQAALGRASEALHLAHGVGAATVIRAARDLLSELGAGADAGPTTLPGLTRRETEILRFMAQGLDNREIATKLVLSVRTVERHVSNVYLKLGVDGPTARVAATGVALRHGIA
jgi:DNA-binding CsgD family transcriptional regulator